MDKVVWLIVIFGLIIAIAATLMVLISPKKRKIVDKDIVYNDRYLEIYPEHMILNGFFLGPIGRKKISFNSIDAIKEVRLNVWKGSYRIQGTGDFKTWFTHDINRSSKEKVFILHRDHKWWRVGFSVEDFDKVAAIFESKGLLLSNKSG